MSEQKHTPGEWWVEDFYNRAQRLRVKSTHKRGTVPTTICAMGSVRVGRTFGHNPHAECDAEDEANAHLIAAAPDLYEALKAIAELVEDAKPGDPDDEVLYAIHGWAEPALASATEQDPSHE